MKKSYLMPQMQIVVLDSEGLVLCASSNNGGSASADNFIKDDLTGDNDFWN